MKLEKLTLKQVRTMNVEWGTSYLVVYQSTNHPDDDDFASLTRDSDGTWIFYYMNRMQEFKNKDDAVAFMKGKGCELVEPEPVAPKQAHASNPYERTRSRVYGTGNRWAIENFNATH